MNSPKENALGYITAGVTKAKLSIDRMLVLGILAGAFIALAGAAAAAAGAAIGTPVGKLIGAMIFPGGLAMVIVAGSELFTGNNMIIISVLAKETTWGRMLKNWLFVYIGNLIGSLIIAALMNSGHSFDLFGGAFGGATINTAVAKVSMSFGDAFIRGVLCNFLVCIAVWMAFAAKDVAGKIIGLFFPIAFFVFMGFEHSVANMYMIPAGIIAAGNPAYAAQATAADLGVLTWGAFFVKNLLPVTLGNIVGGAGLMSCAYWFVYCRGESRKAAQAARK